MNANAPLPRVSQRLAQASPDFAQKLSATQALLRKASQEHAQIKQA